MYTFRTFAIDFSEFSRRAAPHNFILDMLVDFRGATRDSDVTALELISPLVWTHLAYSTVPYAFSDTSVKTFIGKEPI